MNDNTLKHLEPNPEADLKRLEQIFWDFDYKGTGKDLYDFILKKKEIQELNRSQVKARMLMTVGWYNLIDIFGLKNLRDFFTADVLEGVWVDSLRDNYKYVGGILERLLPEAL
jgi:hypothetical protein